MQKEGGLDLGGFALPLKLRDRAEEWIDFSDEGRQPTNAMMRSPSRK